jgi:hypothetical protein
MISCFTRRSVNQNTLETSILTDTESCIVVLWFKTPCRPSQPDGYHHFGEHSASVFTSALKKWAASSSETSVTIYQTGYNRSLRRCENINFTWERMPLSTTSKRTRRLLTTFVILQTY